VFIHEDAIRPALRKLLPDPFVLTPTEKGGYVLEGTAVLDLNEKRPDHRSGRGVPQVAGARYARVSRLPGPLTLPVAGTIDDAA
jgi:hypothetical protein